MAWQTGIRTRGTGEGNEELAEAKRRARPTGRHRSRQHHRVPAHRGADAAAAGAQQDLERLSETLAGRVLRRRRPDGQALQETVRAKRWTSSSDSSSASPSLPGSSGSSSCRPEEGGRDSAEDRRPADHRQQAAAARCQDAEIAREAVDKAEAEGAELRNNAYIRRRREHQGRSACAGRPWARRIVENGDNQGELVRSTLVRKHRTALGLSAVDQTGELVRGHLADPAAKRRASTGSSPNWRR